ncbi:MAG TPA: hypothetical protein VE621_15110, partial [Bryobacteraceae bacterium]|nr:hypothetical protein [Bryobacteraceae bacterium]
MSPTSQFEPTLTEYLRSLSKPETLDTLKKRFRNQPIEQQLSELLESGAAHAWPPYGNVKRGRYWFQGSDELIEKALLDTSARKLINKQDLLRGARKASFGPSEVTVKQVFEKLVAAGRLKVVKLPPNNAVRIWNPESPELVLEAHRKAFLTLTGKLEKIGVPQDALRKFLPSLVKAPTLDLAEQIYQAIAEVEPKHGV